MKSISFRFQIWNVNRVSEKVALMNPFGFRNFGANTMKYDTCTCQSLDFEMTGERRSEINPPGFPLLEGEQIEQNWRKHVSVFWNMKNV